MSLSDPNEPGFDSSTTRWIQAHIDWVDDLPHPDEEWISSDVDVDHKHLPALRKNGIVEIVGSQPSEAELSTDPVNIYTTTEPAWDRIRYYIETRETGDVFMPCPCGHTGVSNLGDGEYGCGNEDCEGKYSRDELDL